ncbi:three-helix bundle dimerization domain-containing protein [uncultured Microbacterium sp.]|uniref:three-helix bundle dimerization domain-containing protein n=1 Tax=uncultured Microbacterium sp. TaxID=191216 RepID=UPI0035CB4EF2
MTTTAPDEAATIDEIVERLSARFPEVPPRAVRDVVTKAYNEVSDAHVRDFIAVLVEKQAKQTLSTLKR